MVLPTTISAFAYLLILPQVFSFVVFNNAASLKTMELFSWIDNRQEKRQPTTPPVSPEDIGVLLHSESELVQLEFVGMSNVDIVGSSESAVACAVLKGAAVADSSFGVHRYLVVPNCETISRYLDPKQQPQQRWQLILWNGEVINRDDGIFDNLPYVRWTAYHEKDAASNTVNKRYHLGKRTFYNYMMGRDWYKTARKELFEQRQQKSEDQQLILARRVQELRIRELEMELASAESNLAISRQQQEPNIDEAMSRRDECSMKLNNARERLEQFSSLGENRWRWIEDILVLGNEQQSKEDDYDQKSLPPEAFDNPYRLLETLVDRLLKARIVGVVLEDASWFEGTTLGGVCILQRNTAIEEVKILGEPIQIENPDKRFGNDDVSPGELLAVDCHADEALALHIACGVPIWTDSSVCHRSSIALMKDQTSKSTADQFEPLDDTLALAYEGMDVSLAVDDSVTVADVRIPLNSIPKWDTVVSYLRSSTSTQQPGQVFPTDNPIQSLTQYDGLSNVDKVRTLSQSSNFDNSNLPRPRATRANPALLDQLLLPLIDESVRTQYRIRETGDDSIPKSRRLIAREQLQKALERGDREAVKFWEETTKLDVRADVTQDEGSYSRFLDRDEWYERDRKRTSSRVDRSQFGTLLDGIE